MHDQDARAAAEAAADLWSGFGFLDAPSEVLEMLVRRLAHLVSGPGRAVLAAPRYWHDPDLDHRPTEDHNGFVSSGRFVGPGLTGGRGPVAKGGRVAVVGEAAMGGVVEEREAEGAGTRAFVTWLRTHGVTAVSR